MSAERKDDPEYEVVIAPEVLEQMAQDPEMAAAIREICAAFRQSAHAVKTGQHNSFEDAMEAITGNRPEPVFDDEEDAP